MAASCVTASLLNSSGVVVAGGLRDNAVGRQAGRMALATPSVSGGGSLALAAGLIGVSLSALVGGAGRSGRNAAIAARAADLEQGLEDLAGLDSSLPELPPPPPQGTKLYVGNLPWSVHSKQLAEVFQEVGNVELVEVIYDRESQKSRGFAFVTMSTEDDAQRAIDLLNGSELDGRVIKVNFPAATRDGPRFRTPRREEGASTENKLFVGNLSWAVDDLSLDDLFRQYGKVLEAKVIHDRETGRSRGFGFVTLSSASEVNHAISSLDGKEFDKRLLRVNLAGDKPPSRGGEIRFD